MTYFDALIFAALVCTACAMFVTAYAILLTFLQRRWPRRNECAGPRAPVTTPTEPEHPLKDEFIAGFKEGWRDFWSMLAIPYTAIRWLWDWLRR